MFVVASHGWIVVETLFKYAYAKKLFEKKKLKTVEKGLGFKAQVQVVNCRGVFVCGTGCVDLFHWVWDTDVY